MQREAARIYRKLTPITPSTHVCTQHAPEHRPSVFSAAVQRCCAPACDTRNLNVKGKEPVGQTACYAAWKRGGERGRGQRPRNAQNIGGKKNKTKKETRRFFFFFVCVWVGRGGGGGGGRRKACDVTSVPLWGPFAG